VDVAFGRPLPLALAMGADGGFFSPATNLLGGLDLRALRALAAVIAVVAVAAIDLRPATLAIVKTSRRGVGSGNEVES